MRGRRWAASWAARAERLAGCSALAGLAGGWLGRLLVVRVGPSSWLGGLLLFFLFYFSFLFHLFEFKFGLKFDFTTEVTCSLEFREFYFNNNFMVYYFIGVV